jgi:hypothetical protein
MAAAHARAGEIGYVEDFVFAREDRQVALDQLIPGTEDYYYYYCLHYQHLGEFDKAQEMLGRWIKQHNYTERALQIENRQFLLTYERNPQATLDLITRRLNLQFNHQRQTRERQQQLPTALAPVQIARDTLAKLAFSRHENLEGFSDAALDWLTQAELNPQQLRHLLERLQRPDYPNLPRLIVSDLNTRGSRGFGSLPIHHNLLLEQLDECIKLEPSLKNEVQFVRVYLTKLQPNADIDWVHNPEERVAYLERLWNFAKDLAPAHNTLKANILYHRLDVDRSLGVYSKERFMTYLRLPRPLGYVPRPYLERPENRGALADLNAAPIGVEPFGPIINDEPLVRDYLSHFLVDETNYRAYEPFVENVYLKELFAETKLLHGQGDAEQWYAMLPPAKLQAIKDRIEIDFAPTNPVVFASDASVSLEVDVKNVSKLLVKVFEINALNYYRSQQSEVNTDINLDGLVANHETSYEYSEAPIRRVRRKFEFPEMSKPGIYVVDLIGNGTNSRVVVRKGRLNYLVRQGTAGHVFTIIDDKDQIVVDGKLWMSGREFTPTADGEILVPYSTHPLTHSIVLSRGDWASLHLFMQSGEDYRLEAGFYVDRESLLAHNDAEVLVRPQLLVNGVPVSVDDLKDIRLEVTTTDVDGIESQIVVNDFKLDDQREATYRFHVPPRVVNVRATLYATIKRLSTGDDVTLSDQASFDLNGIERTAGLAAAHLQKTVRGYVTEYLGKSGEPRPNVVVALTMQHHDFNQPVHVVLQTDENGHVALGKLPGISSLTVNVEGNDYYWPIVQDRYDYQSTLHGAVGDVIQVPYVDGGEVGRDKVSLLELRGESFYADRFDAIEAVPGFLNLKGLSAGDYDLWLKESNQRTRIRVTEGPEQAGYVIGDYRKLEKTTQRPLQIVGAEVAEDALVIQTANFHDDARVHVIATRYQPAYPVFDGLVVPQQGPSAAVTPSFVSLYLSGRNIGDEYRYIIDRRFAARLPGNMLDRPSLLLNPWAIRDTQTARQDAMAGDDFAPTAEPAAAPEFAEKMAKQAEALRRELGQYANLDYLKDGAVVLTNLTADENGQVRIPLEKLGAHQQIHIVAIDPETTVVRHMTREAEGSQRVDLRLAQILDASKHYALQKQISEVDAQQSMTINDVTASRYEVYDSLQRVYQLYKTLSNDDRLNEFGFVLNWPKLSSDEKHAKYSEFACHELNFFIYHKDPEFFREVITPYLTNKQDKTFLDLWLLGDDLNEYLSPWKYNRLNVVEQSLLARRVAEQRTGIVRDVQDRWDLIPRDRDRWNIIFETALKGSALDATLAMDGEEEALGLQDAPAGGGFGGGGGAFGLGGAVRKSRGAVAESMAESRNGVVADSLDAGLAAPAPASAMPGAPMDARRRLGRTASDRGRLGEQAPLYQQVDKTKEWVENNYYKLPIEQQLADLVRVNAFWNDFAQHDGSSAFRSVHLAQSTGNLTEMMMALAVLDLPLQSPETKKEYAQAKLTVTAAAPLVVFHEQITESPLEEKETSILVSQNFFRADDRYEEVQGERHDKFVSEEFLVHVVYGCQIVVTNPSSSQQKVDALIQIPEGAIPVNSGRYTRGVALDLPPYHTQTIEYYFYFPKPGDFAHFPVHVSKDGTTVAHVEPVRLNVVAQPSTIDESSWAHVSQHGSTESVLKYLSEKNLHKIALSEIAFRMQEAEVFGQVIDILRQRHVYDHVLWSYGVKHNTPDVIREFLVHEDGFVAQTGRYLVSPLLVIDPVARLSYQLMDYRPLINARAHTLGRRRQIVNDRFHQQYHNLLEILSLRPTLNADDKMTLVAYLLLQDRVPEAIDFFNEVNPEELATRLQYDYFTAYLDCYNDSPDKAAAIAQQYANYPVDRWRESFEAVGNLVKEVRGGDTQVADADDLTQRQTQLASQQPAIELKVETDEVRVAHRNVEKLTVNFYQMDLELLFSRQPFVQQSSDHFSYIQPNATETLTVEKGQGNANIAIPEKLRRSNVLVEVLAGGQRRVQTYYANSLNVQMMENFGQLRITQTDEDKPLPRVYVKVYAQMKDGQVRFYKDGYTDIRGRFDYASLSTNDLDAVQKFALLVVSDQHGSTVRDTAPPAR